MKTTKLTFTLFLFSFVFFTSTLAQVEEKPEAKVDEKTEVNKPNSIESNGDKIEFKNETGNSILTITDEGNTAGSLELKDVIGVPTNTKKLLNSGGNLFWGSNQLGAGGATSLDGLIDAKYIASNLFLGDGAGATETGSNMGNLAVGLNSFLKNITGDYNTALGNFSLYNSESGHSNNAIGESALYSNTTGSFNIAIGREANYFNEQGSNNTIIGHLAGRGVATHNKSGNIFIGYRAGYNETGSNKLYIANSDNAKPLIGGDFSTNHISFNGRATLNYSTPQATFTINAYDNETEGIDVTNNATTGKAVVGFASNLGDVTNYGGYFTSKGIQGRAVYGDASTVIPSGSENYGGYFLANGDNGRGVYGNANGFGGTTYGGYFTSNGNNGRGVFAEANADDGRGVLANAHGANGRAVAGYANGLNGRGIYGNAPITGWAGYFDGRGYFSENVGIGEVNPPHKLQVVSSTSGAAVAEFVNTTVNGDGIRIKIGPITNPTTTNDYLFFLDGDATAIGSVEGNGSGGVSYNTTSDARLKMNIKEYSNALNALSRIGIKKYERISNPGIEEIGVIAQELQNVYPQAVSGSPDSDVKTDPMMVDYSKLTPLLVKGMQEQQETISSQNVRIKELEERLAKLESLLDGKRFTSVSN